MPVIVEVHLLAGTVSLEISATMQQNTDYAHQDLHRCPRLDENRLEMRRNQVHRDSTLQRSCLTL